ncbi:desmoglein-2 [Rhinatrema bivittatum]|uniref:desmoglein-2 n=1 Tax=Rhinatrema bivittatum TaxID=194408 RepID=UPI00112DFC3C|nr:desmoglein-2 [Rhinatrema bivittatum]
MGPSALVLGSFLLLTVSLDIGYGLHIQIAQMSNNLQSNLNGFVRQKREWIIPPANILEESDNSAKNPIARIQSDIHLDVSKQITYKITGQGVTEPPYGLFVINSRTGDLNITGIVDREEIQMLHLRGYALDQDGNNVEPPIDLRVKVIDINDNSPVCTQDFFTGSVEEMSPQNTVVMRVNATDADEEGTLNTKLAFRILSQDPGQSQLFMINKDTGEIRTMVSSLDREQQAFYTLNVEVKDRGGDQTGRTGKCAVRINLLDVNDNIPVLEKEMYEGSVDENVANVEILRMKAFDNDEEHTDNWLANFTILSGNENGYFKIETDSATNEGVLMLVKEVDYEEMQNLELKVAVSNKAAYHSSVSSGGSSSSIGKLVPVKVKVKNVLEGPEFKPKIKPFSVSENKKTTVKNQLIGSYPAYSRDTGKIADHVRYAKEYDPDNWFTIDPTTAEIRLSKIPDRESINVVNGTYVAKILAISEDLPGQTATGTIALKVEDANDNCPTIVEPIQTVCDDTKYINVTAVDKDAFPNGAPFTFTIVDEPPGTAKNWIIGRKEATSIQLVPQDLWHGTHEVQIQVADRQGVSCPEKQVLKLTVCTCSPGAGCTGRLSEKSTNLGAGAVGLMILACLLLLLVPLLLLLCHCGGGGKGFTAIPDGTVEMLRSWNSEGAQPEDMAVLPPLLSSGNMETGAGVMKVESGFVRNGLQADAREIHSATNVERWEDHRYMLNGAGYGAAAGGAVVSAGAASRTLKAGGGAGAAGAGGALNEEFLKGYFGDKASSYADEDEAQPAKDCLLVYCQEGMGSPTGSVGCCSFVDDDLEQYHFDNLGPKFKTLAEICLGKELTADIDIQQQSFHGPRADISSAAGVGVSGLSMHAGESTHSSYESSILAPELVKIPEVVTQQNMYTEESFSRSGLQVPRPVPDPQIHGSILVTEKSYTTVPAVKPTAVIRDPRLQQNLVVTERVLAPASGFHGIMDIPDLSNSQNVMVTERLIKADSGVPGLLAVNELPDSQYVVVTERLLAPSSGLQTNLSIPDLTDGQKVVVTERLLTPVDGFQGGMRIPAEFSGAHNIVKEKKVISGVGVQGHLLSPDPLFNQPSIVIGDPSASNHSLGQSSSKVTKYSTVQYTR